MFFKASCALIRCAPTPLPADLPAGVLLPGAGLDALLADVVFAEVAGLLANDVLVAAVFDDAALDATDFTAATFAGVVFFAAVLSEAVFAATVFAGTALPAAVFAGVAFSGPAFPLALGVGRLPAVGLAFRLDAALAAAFPGPVVADPRVAVRDAAPLRAVDLPVPDLLAALLAAGLRVVAMRVSHRRSPRMPRRILDNTCSMQVG